MSNHSVYNQCRQGDEALAASEATTFCNQGPQYMDCRQVLERAVYSDLWDVPVH